MIHVIEWNKRDDDLIACDYFFAQRLDSFVQRYAPWPPQHNTTAIHPIPISSPEFTHGNEC